MVKQDFDCCKSFFHFIIRQTEIAGRKITLVAKALETQTPASGPNQK